jgi:hypothetical protein
VWLVLAIAIGVVGIRVFLAESFRPTGRGPVEILIIAALVLQPLVILLLIVRAIRLQGVGRPLRIVARALYPLVSVILSSAFAGALMNLAFQSDLRRVQRWRSGSITYVCSTYSPTADYDPKTIGATKLRLTEYRHPGKLGTWIVAWPVKTPITATSFDARTGSIGGSQGIKWREPDGRHTTAYLSFSDLMIKYGPESIWVALVQGDEAARALHPDAMRSTMFTCGPDPTSYRG